MSIPDTPDLSAMTRREIEDYLVERAMVEPDFRSRLLHAPEPLLRDLGLRVGSGVTVRVLEEEPKSFFIVLPRVLREMEELTDEELDHVEGGVPSTHPAQNFFSGYL